MFSVAGHWVNNREEYFDVSVNTINYTSKYFINPQDFIPLRTETKNKKFYNSLEFNIGSQLCISWL